MYSIRVLTVYTTSNCYYCRRIKGFLESHQIDFTEIDLSDDLEGRVELMQRTGRMTFPQILHDGEFFGDCEETEALLLSDLAKGSEDVPSE